MKLPKQLDIFGENYDVLEEDLCEEDALGKCNQSTKLIKICKKGNTNREMTLHTLIHEMGHGAWEELSLSQIEALNPYEEIICNSWATLIMKNFDIRIKRRK